MGECDLVVYYYLQIESNCIEYEFAKLPVYVI